MRHDYDTYHKKDTLICQNKDSRAYKAYYTQDECMEDNPDTICKQQYTCNGKPFDDFACGQYAPN